MAKDFRTNVEFNNNVTVTGNINAAKYQSSAPASPLTGQVWVDSSTDISTFDGTVQTGNRNILTNGSFKIDQRNSGAAQTIVSAQPLAYTVDRWYAYCTGANVTGARTTGTSPDQYYYRFTGATSNTAIGFGQRIEANNSYHFSGKTATLSLSLASTSLTSITWTAYYATSTDTFGTIASPNKTQISTGTFTINSTLTRYSASISVPSAAITGIEIIFTSGALVASQTLTFSNVQFELGSSATPLEIRPISQELALCQRYYYRQTALTTSDVLSSFGIAASTTSARLVVPLPASMRVGPTSIDFSSVALGDAISTRNNVSAIGFYSSTPTVACIDCTSTGLTSARPQHLMSQTPTLGYLGFSAEL
jgi:hypothetical protein